jgi:hypothetical protein
MRHALILRALNLLLLAALAIISATVILHPIYQARDAAAREQKRAAAAPHRQSKQPAIQVATITQSNPVGKASNSAQSDGSADAKQGVLENEPQSSPPTATVVVPIGGQHGELPADAPSDVPAPQRVIAAIRTLFGGLTDSAPAIKRSLLAAAARTREAGRTLANADTADQPLANETHVVAVQDADSLSNVDGPPRSVSIENPLEHRLSVSFLLNGAIKTLAPGERLVVTAAAVLVRFDRGGAFGTATLDLTSGRYRFTLSSADGWALERDETEVVD